MRLFKYIFALLFFISPVKKTEASDLVNAITKEELIAVINDDNTITDLKTSILFKEIKQNMVSSMLAAEAEAYDGNVMALLAIKLLDWGIKGIDQYQLAKNRWDSNAGNYDPFLPDPYRNAYICGLYNGLLKEAKAIPELAHLLIKISTSEKNRQQFSEDIEKLLEEGVLTTIAEGLIKKYGNKPVHELSYYAGETTITVATFFVSFGAVTQGGKITNLVKLVNPLQDAIGVLNKVSKAGLVLQRSGQVFLLKTALEANVFLAKIDAENVFKEVRWLNEGQVIEQLENITYIDNGVQNTASLALVKQGDEVGFRVVDKLDELATIFAGARQRAIAKFGEEAEDLIYIKFSKNGGAAAVIIDHYGDAGLVALKKVNKLDDVASELIKGKTMYRHIDENVNYLNSLKESGEIPSGYTTYVTLDKFDDPVRASSKMQLPPENNAVWRIEFEGNQLVNKIQFPNGKFNNTDYKEVLTRSFPEWGEGGATQFITTSSIKVRKLTNLKTGEIINFE